MTEYRTMAREDFWNHAQRARNQGKDLGEVLDREGVLLTEARKHQIRGEAFEEILNILKGTEVNAWFRPGTPITPRDFKETLELYLEAKTADEYHRARL